MNPFNDTLAERSPLDEATILARIDADDDLELLGVADGAIEVFDHGNEKELTFYRDPFVDLENRLTLPDSIDRTVFERVLRDCIDPNSMQTVERLVILGDEGDYDAFYDEYPFSDFDPDEHAGMYFFHENMVVVNLWLIGRLYPDIDDQLAALWETVAHELRHVVTANPVVLDTDIPAAAGDEDAVEVYGRQVYARRIYLHGDRDCFA